MKQKNLDILKQKGSGFKVPDGYFKSIEDTVLSELIAEEFADKSGYSVPEGYLNLSNSVLNLN